MATEQEIAELKEHIEEGAAETKSYLASLQGKLGEYDAQYKVTDTASSYLQAGIDTTHAAVDELKHLGSSLTNTTIEKTEPIVRLSKAALAKVHASLEDLKNRALDYDQRAKASLSATASSTRDSVYGIVTSTRSTAMSGIERINQTLESIHNKITAGATAVGESAFALSGTIVKKAELVDEKLGFSGTVAGAANAISGKVSELDKKFGVSETAIKVDEKVSGGLGVSLIGKVDGLLNQGVDLVSSTIQSAKAAADKK